MEIFKKPGASLLLVGAALFFVVQPIVGAVPLVGGVIAPMAFIVGALGIVGGGYLMARSVFGTGR